ncbi:MAG: hypothetical protein J6P57_04020 [Lachnospiraceae bacterium]|nr:hypothetical protein [Lachnospiraceae bacterium]
MKKKKGSLETVKFVLVAIFLVAIVLIYFNHLGNRSSKRKEAATKSEMEELETFDFISNYPKTPRDVVKMHCRFFKLLYGEGVSDDDLVILNQQVRNLYSQEILAFNTENDNLVNLKKNIQKMKDEGYNYKVYELPEASQVKYYKREGREMAALEITLTLDTSESKSYMYVVYVLIKENDKWKIYAWGAPDMSGTEQ